jgi:predicted chitinase
MTKRAQFYEIIRDLKWIIIISILICVLLYVPDQVSELYRISATEDGSVAAAQFISLIAIAAIIWFGAFQVTTETMALRGPFTGMFTHILRVLPPALGTLPLLAAAIAQLSSRPKTLSSVAGKLGLTDADLAALKQVGSVFRIQEEALKGDATALWSYFLWLIAIAIIFAVLTWLLGERLRTHSTTFNVAYFRERRFLLVTFAVIFSITAIFILNPVRVPQLLGPFGILAAFTLCIVAFCIHLSLLTVKHQIPFIPIVLFFCLLIAASDLNDNHYIRSSSTKDIPSNNATPAVRLTSGDAFVQWLKRPDRLNYASSPSSNNSVEYPVFVLSAQGGGIYAAYNAAIFLARMQDLCPAFRDHLFAVSSVSGGSIGAATFAAALDAADHAAATAPKAGGDLPAGPCPSIAEFLSNAHAKNDLDKPGRFETKVDAALSSDFLSPLIAATLFPDFTQSFLPFPFPFLDRARALEYALEDGAEKMYAGSSEEKSRLNLLKMDYQRHWSPEKSIPALLMNATDTGSGKRVLLSPFDLDRRNPKDSDICVLANVSYDSKNPDSGAPSTSLHFPLSTAAVVSARFPWVTPAATVAKTNPCITSENKARLVDGGYVDNSGVETALNLIEEIKTSADQVRQQHPSAIPPFRIYLISLAGGDFPEHGSFSFNELVEPVRALLSGRESRAYIALNRAATQVKITAAPAAAERQWPTYSRANLKNFFYNLPLGWAISDKTRDIIALDSGRYWDCEPDANFSQKRKRLSNGDCIQLKIYHLLNNSTTTAIKDQENSQKVASRLAGKIGSEKQAGPRLDHEALLNCYEKSWLPIRDLKSRQAQLDAWKSRPDDDHSPMPRYKRSYLAYYQSERLRDLLREWDQQPETDPNVLSYILGSISYDSNEFRVTTENLSLNSVEQIKAVWGKRIEKSNPGASDADLSKLVNNPQALANFVWGYPGNDFGNNPINRDGTFDPKKADDGWSFRPRGVYQIIGREQFRDHSRWLARLYPDLQINILDEPDAVWNQTISAKVAYAHFHFRRYDGQTLIERLKRSPGDWQGVRRLQTDMGSENPPEVAERSTMFQGCIEDATRKLQSASSTGGR